MRCAFRSAGRLPGRPCCLRLPRNPRLSQHPEAHAAYGIGPGTGTWFQNNYSYDGIGDLIENKLPGYLDVVSTFDAAGREVSSATNGTSYLSAGVYNAFGELLSANMSPSLSENRSYDTRGRLTGIARADYNLSDVDYAGDGQILSLDDSANGGVWNYSYDDINRLLTAANGNNQAGYSYDRDGNRWGESLNFTPTCGDWSADPEPVPYANLGDPQTLNLYAYAGNNPVSVGDPSGHEPPTGNPSPLGAYGVGCWIDGGAVPCGMVGAENEETEQQSDQEQQGIAAEEAQQQNQVAADMNEMHMSTQGLHFLERQERP